MLTRATLALFGMLIAALSPMKLSAGQSVLKAPDRTGDVYRDYRSQEVIAWRKRVVIPFPDGSSMEVLLRRTPAVIGPVTESLSGEYPALRKAYLGGNPDAAYALYKGLKRCRLSKEPRFAAESAAHSDFCEGMTSEQLSEEQAWLDVAANAGVAWALLERAMQTEPSSERVRAWEAVWQTGSINALAWIAKTIREGWSGPDAAKPDRIRAYAYSYLHYHLQRTAHEAVGGGPIRAKFVAGEAALLDGRAAELSQAERDQALGLAKTILAQSETCCFIG